MPAAKSSVVLRRPVARRKTTNGRGSSPCPSSDVGVAGHPPRIGSLPAMVPLPTACRGPATETWRQGRGVADGDLYVQVTILAITVWAIVEMWMFGPQTTMIEMSRSGTVAVPLSCMTISWPSCTWTSDGFSSDTIRYRVLPPKAHCCPLGSVEWCQLDGMRIYRSSG